MLVGPAATQPTARRVGSDYLLALSAAERFLSAWQTRDQDAGLALLSPRLRKSRPDRELRMYLSGLSNPHHQAYEIGPGRRQKDGRYAFEVRLYEHYTGQQESEPRPNARKLILVRTGSEAWKVDRLP